MLFDLTLPFTHQMEMAFGEASVDLFGRQLYTSHAALL
jgi:hypothetical protein